MHWENNKKHRVSDWPTAKKKPRGVELGVPLILLKPKSRSLLRYSKPANRQNKSPTYIESNENRVVHVKLKVDPPPEQMSGSSGV